MSFLFPSPVQESMSLDINYMLSIELELCKIPHERALNVNVHLK